MMRALIVRLGGLLPEIGPFGVVGVICFGIDFAIFNALREPTGEPIVAKVVSTVVATTAAFVGNRFWTWRHRERSGLVREYPLYFAVNLVGLGIAVACLWTTHHWLGTYWPVLTTTLADNLSANVVGVGLASLFRFWAYRRYVFRVDPVPGS
jgi:putative flippase GtrA